MRRHHAGQAGRQPLVGAGVVGQDRLERALVGRHRDMAVGLGPAVAREVLAAVGHAGLQQALHQAARQRRGHPRVAVEGAVADDAAAAVVQVEHRREAQVDAAGAQLGRQHPAGGAGHVAGGQRAVAFALGRVVHPALAEGAHRRQVGEAVAAEALHPAALVVDADHDVGPDRLDLGHQPGQLRAVLPVAAEQDQAAGERMRQAAAVVVVQRQAGDIEHDRRMRRDDGLELGLSGLFGLLGLVGLLAGGHGAGLRVGGSRRRRSWWRSRSRRSG